MACIIQAIGNKSNHGWKVEGDQGLGPSQHRGACGLGWAGLGWEREGVAPPAVRVRGITPRNFLKKMLNPAF